MWLLWSVIHKLGLYLNYTKVKKDKIQWGDIKYKNFADSDFDFNDGEVIEYRCRGCYFSLKNEDEMIVMDDDLATWIEKNCPQE